MGSGAIAMAELPPGFVLDQAAALPSGFVLDDPKERSVTEALSRAWEKPPEGISIIKMLKSIAGGVTLPGDVYSGKVPMSPTGEIPEEVIKRSTDLAASLPLAQAPGGVLAAPQGALGMGFSRPGQIAGQQAVPPPVAAASQVPTMEAAQRIGVELPRYLVDESRMTQGMAEGLKNIPGAGDKIAKAAERTVEGLGAATSRTAEGFGTGSPAVAGSYAKDALTDWMTSGSREAAERVYSSVDKLVNPDVAAPLAETAKAASAIVARRDASRIPGKSAAVETVLDAATTPEGLTYEGIKGLRSFLGEMTPQELASQGLRGSEVKQLYGALTKDLRGAVMQAGGPRALAAFEKANRVYDQISQRREMLGKIVGAKGDASPEAVYARLAAMASSKSSADIGRLTAARKSMGVEAWNEVAAAVIAKLGRDPQGDFSIKRFLTAYGNLSDAGRSALFRSSGKNDLARSLDDINFVVKQVEEKLLKFYNPSGTAKSMAATETVMGIIHAPIKTLATMLGGSKMARILSEPASARATADWIKAYQAVIENPTDAPKARAAMQASRRLAGFVAREAGVTEEVALTQLLATPVMSQPASGQNPL